MWTAEPPKRELKLYGVNASSIVSIIMFLLILNLEGNVNRYF